MWAVSVVPDHTHDVILTSLPCKPYIFTCGGRLRSRENGRVGVSSNTWKIKNIAPRLVGLLSNWHGACLVCPPGFLALCGQPFRDGTEKADGGSVATRGTAIRQK
jgi:hypothetical protein